MNDNDFLYLGKRTTEPTKELDIFEAPRVSLVRFESDELTAFCPVTRQPDFYHVLIEYRPASFCVESKSLKLYLQSFRDDGVFAEALAAQIAGDLYRAIMPRWLRVSLRQQVRGGLQLTAVAELGDVDE